MEEALKKTRLKVRISNDHPEEVTAKDVTKALAAELSKLKKSPLFSSSEDILVITAEVGYPLDR